MRRKFKFRVWDNIDKEFITNFSLGEDDNLYIECRCCDGAPSSREINIISQFTGLKDSNGKDIYEGDIIKFVFRNNEENEYPQTVNICPVVWDKKWCAFMAGEQSIGLGCSETHVIGNIYQNPELLEMKNENQHEAV